jgi:hypothetical protein
LIDGNGKQTAESEQRKKSVFFSKVNSVQEACAKCFAAHISKFEILQTTRKNKTKTVKMLDLLMKN